MGLLTGRDREVANRLKILKVTLLVTILVALISLGYDMIVDRSGGQGQVPVSSQPAAVSAGPGEASVLPIDEDEADAGVTSDVREAQSTR